MEFMRVQKLRLVDLFHQMDKNNSTGISVAEFQQGLQVSEKSRIAYWSRIWAVLCENWTKCMCAKCRSGLTSAVRTG
ncbi:hypothetical protein DPMN_112828 [Dreissena polymorpha]|uniref:EF-hand domain-containing protein n=1 Tax=Dreissena polymorpha TaxID=45954 RepID=A0A9D4QQD6_DREPO|nr:hypothetical protein DPMN_112828 [Dreissena polymorpha]